MATKTPAGSAKPKTLPLMSRDDIEAMIADGKKLMIVNQEVLRVDAWIPYHPGGDKAILHMVGRDATDEVTVYAIALDASHGHCWMSNNAC